jgi:ATP-dependent RNA helicase RhlE
MATFEDFKVSKQLANALEDRELLIPTPIQEKSFPVILSGKDMVGIAQTGTGKTIAYLLPILQQLKFSKQVNPRVLIMVPTRELVVQILESIAELTKYMNIRSTGVTGETNIVTQRQELAQGTDIIVATPGRIYDLVLGRSISFKDIGKLVIDEVDVMLDLGFLPQLTNIFDLLPHKRQNIMFSATMTDEVDELIDLFFTVPERVAVALSGTPLHNIDQKSYSVQNFNTKVNLLVHLLQQKQDYTKVLVFVLTKKLADQLFDRLTQVFGSNIGIIHSNKSQNNRQRTIEEFEGGQRRILIATDVIARGLDIEGISQVINFDVPTYPENYMHRIGRTGRAEQPGQTILFFSEKEINEKNAIETLMDYQIPLLEFPEDVEINEFLTDKEKEPVVDKFSLLQAKAKRPGLAIHEKKAKNQKVNLGGSYKKKLAEKYKKPISRGDKHANKKKK